MSTYLLNFIVYATAMIGVIFVAVFVYKKFSYNSVSKSQFLNVEDCISLAPRKNLYVVRAGKERFLVASDAERTTLISKLGQKEQVSQIQSEQMYKENAQSSVDELPQIVNFKKAKGSNQILKNIVNNI